MLCCVQVLGHFAANLDPLGLDHRPVPPQLDPAYYGFQESDMDRECVAGAAGAMEGVARGVSIENSLSRRWLYVQYAVFSARARAWVHA